MFELLRNVPYRFTLAYVILGISVVFYAGFWVWGMIHAASTPKASPAQKIFWTLALLINPSGAVWYWYVWKRWAFWLLFTPIFGFFLSLPFVVRSLLTHAQASFVTNALFALGTEYLLILVAVLCIYPILLRLIMLLHLGRNKELDAFDRNDWVTTVALPLYGFGAAMAYCAKYCRLWGVVSLVWLLAIMGTFRFVTANTVQALISVGAEKRIEFRARLPLLRMQEPNRP